MASSISSSPERSTSIACGMSCGKASTRTSETACSRTAPSVRTAGDSLLKWSGTSAWVFSVRLTRAKSTWSMRPLTGSRETSWMRAGISAPSRPVSASSVVFPQRRYESSKPWASVSTGSESA